MVEEMALHESAEQLVEGQPIGLFLSNQEARRLLSAGVAINFLKKVKQGCAPLVIEEATGGFMLTAYLAGSVMV